ncbi:MAG: cell division ATP-binding protein FtsE [Bdellovibrionota bacterium]
MIQFHRVKKSYEAGENIFSGLDLNIEKGEFIFLTGKSGSGKTTLLKLIFLEERPDQGQILVDGRNIIRASSLQKALLRRSIGVVFQDFKLISNYSIYENVALPLKMLGMNKNVIRQKVTSMLRMVGLESKLKVLPQKLSGGEQQRVAIARALVNEPKILLADEPTGNLDPELSQEILDLFQNIHVRGTTVVMATHDQNLVSSIRGRVIDLNEVHRKQPS